MRNFFVSFFFILNALKLKRILSSVTVSTMYGILQNLSNGTLHVCGVPESMLLLFYEICSLHTEMKGLSFS